MREHKYRVWDGKKMVYQSRGLTTRKTWYPLSFEVDRICEPMQYLGRKDKNGKEIYEGDIDCTDGECMYVSYDERDAVYGLKYCKPIDETVATYTDSLIDWNQVEIVGNVYENPELLSEEVRKVI